MQISEFFKNSEIFVGKPPSPLTTESATASFFTPVPNAYHNIFPVGNLKIDLPERLDAAVRTLVDFHWAPAICR